MKALFLGLFCAIFLLMIASVEANFVITDSELRYGGSNTHKQEVFARTIAIRNDFQGYNLQNFALEFTERNGFRRSDIEINTTPTPNLPFGQSGTILVTIHAGDFDIIDENLEERGEVEIGTLSIRADKINETTAQNEGPTTSNSIPVKLELKNDLDLFSVEIKGNEGSYSSISADSTKTIIVDEDYDLRFKIRNTFESSSEIVLENINIQILSNDLDIDKSTSISEISAAEEGEKITSLSVDSTGDGEVQVLVEGDDQWGGKHGEIFIFNFDVQEAEEDQDVPADENDGDGDGIPDNRDECLDTVSVCDVDATGCPLDSDNDGTCDALDPTPLPLRQAQNEVDTSQGPDDSALKDDTAKKKTTTEDENSTSGFIPFLIGFAVGIMVTAGFSVLIKS